MTSITITIIWHSRGTHVPTHKHPRFPLSTPHPIIPNKSRYPHEKNQITPKTRLFPLCLHQAAERKLQSHRTFPTSATLDCGKKSGLAAAVGLGWNVRSVRQHVVVCTIALVRMWCLSIKRVFGWCCTRKLEDQVCRSVWALGGRRAT
jgi:hypothetical protein